MLRASLALLFMFAIYGQSQAHFLFVVPSADRTSAQVILSEDLQPDENVEVGVVDPAKLLVRDNDGKDTALQIAKKEPAREVALPTKNAELVHGVCDLGVMQRGSLPPFLLMYHPKTILGAPFGKQSQLGAAAAIELNALGKPGDLQFQLMAKGKPVADAELTVISPDGSQKKTRTDASGKTESFAPMGRYGVWARYSEPTPGEVDGKSYQEIRRYPTLVVDINDGVDLQPNAAKQASKHAKLSPMPVAASSFGAVASDGWLYIYGGHIARTHNYDTQAVSHQFHRLNLADGKTWEELPGGPGLQGMNLAACAGKIYRIGGMEPRNKPGDETDNHSVADCACFDPAKGKWESITPLPVPRSSHDVAVVGQKLYVIGGWNMLGEDGEKWCSDMLVMDLSAKNPEWKKLEQPFERRALIAAVAGRKIYVIGGFPEEEIPSLNVDIYDTNTGKWSSGPKLPGRVVNGFAPAACTLDGQVYASVADGSLYRLNAAADGWDLVTHTTPRIVHRLAPHGSKILVLGGASKGENFDLIEVVDLDSPSADQ